MFPPVSPPPLLSFPSSSFLFKSRGCASACARKCEFASRCYTHTHIFEFARLLQTQECEICTRAYRIASLLLAFDVTRRTPLYTLPIYSRVHQVVRTSNAIKAPHRSLRGIVRDVTRDDATVDDLEKGGRIEFLTDNTLSKILVD